MLTIDQFRSQMTNLLPPGIVLDNPGKGTTRIKNHSHGRVSYIHGNSTIRVCITDLFAAYTKFRGLKVSSRELKRYAARVFDSSARPAGHSCNCIFLIMVLVKLGLADEIGGEGKSGQPFYTTFR